MVDTGFHYMGEQNWIESINDNPDKKLKLGRRLVPLKSIWDTDVPILPGWAHDAYIFAFPDKQAPEAWEKYEHCIEQWDRLTQKFSGRIVGFKFKLIPEDDAFVVERAHMAEWQHYTNPNKKEAIRKYALSRIPANEYDGSFRMPELIIRNPINLERLVLHSLTERQIVGDTGDYSITYKPLPILQGNIYKTNLNINPDGTG